VGIHPGRESADRSIEWTWRAYDHTGKLMMSSSSTFDSLTDSMADAKLHGYGAEGA
jgi:hypothetical protein